MRLASKIALPFTALFAALLAALGALLAREILQAVESEVEREQRFVLYVASHPRLTPQLNEAFLRVIRDTARGPQADAAGLELAVFPERGAPLATFEQDAAGAALLLDLALAVEARRRASGSDNPADATAIQAARAELGGRRFLALYRARWLDDRRQDFVLLYPLEALEAAQRRALWRIAALGGGGLLLAVLLGRLVAQWISRPVRRLADAARRVATGGLGETLPADLATSGDEIEELARSFQSMVESLRRSQAELVRTERLAVTGTLAASVAHEIRNPLTSLRMTVELLAAKAARAGDAADQEACAVILGEIDRLALAVDELLTFAHPRPAQRAPTDLNRLVSDAAAFLARQLQHARVEAVLQPDPALPAGLPLDAHKIRQLLVNLVLNAMQAIVRDGAVTVRTRWDPARRAAILEVADTGPGIPEEVRARVFDPFVSTKPGGGGLGLAIARQVAEEHGGSIAFETGPQGTTFRVDLPSAGV